MPELTMEQIEALHRYADLLPGDPVVLSHETMKALLWMAHRDLQWQAEMAEEAAKPWTAEHPAWKDGYATGLAEGREG